jgi:hypothetical protein
MREHWAQLLRKHLNPEIRGAFNGAGPNRLTISPAQTLIILTEVGKPQLEYDEQCEVDIADVDVLRARSGNREPDEIPWARITGVIFYYAVAAPIAIP